MRLVKRLRGERAYTMVELITVVAIMGIVMTGITTVFVQGSNAELDMNNRFQAQSATRIALDKIRKDIHCSSGVTSPTTQGGPVATLKLTDPCALQTTVLTQGALSGTGTGNFTIVSTTGFPTASSTWQIDSEQVTATLSGNTVTVTARGANGTTAVSHAVGAPVLNSSGSVSWCTVTVSGNTGLYRQLGTTCGSASPAIKVVDRLTLSNIFWLQLPFTGSLTTVYVKLPVNVATAKHLSASLDTYTLCDGIVLRNSSRVGSGSYLANPC